MGSMEEFKMRLVLSIATIIFHLTNGKNKKHNP